MYAWGEKEKEGEEEEEEGMRLDQKAKWMGKGRRGEESVWRNERQRQNGKFKEEWGYRLKRIMFTTTTATTTNTNESRIQVSGIFVMLVLFTYFDLSTPPSRPPHPLLCSPTQRRPLILTKRPHPPLSWPELKLPDLTLKLFSLELCCLGPEGQKAQRK